MSSKITKKEYVGTRLPYSPFAIGDYTGMYGFLLDSDTNLGSNVTTDGTWGGTMPIGSSGNILSQDFVYRMPFGSATKITGTIEGTVIVKMIASYLATTVYVRITGISYAVKLIAPDGSFRSIVPVTSIWSGTETLYGLGTGIVSTRTLGHYFAKDIDETVEAGEYLCVYLNITGYKSISGVNAYAYLLCDESAGDFKISIPMLEEE